jgi:hypothetical protein
VIGKRLGTTRYLIASVSPYSRTIRLSLENARRKSGNKDNIAAALFALGAPPLLPSGFLQAAIKQLSKQGFVLGSGRRRRAKIDEHCQRRSKVLKAFLRKPQQDRRHTLKSRIERHRPRFENFGGADPFPYLSSFKNQKTVREPPIHAFRRKRWRSQTHLRSRTSLSITLQERHAA